MVRAQSATPESRLLEDEKSPGWAESRPQDGSFGGVSTAGLVSCRNARRRPTEEREAPSCRLRVLLGLAGENPTKTHGTAGSFHTASSFQRCSPAVSSPPRTHARCSGE